jgi:thioredoxin reductase
MPHNSTYDVAIVGGGPAGLSAAIWLGRYLHRVALVDSGDPRNWETRGVNGYLGIPQCTPAELRGSGRDEARRVGVTLIDGCVETAQRVDEERFRLTYEELRVRKTADNDLRVEERERSRTIEARRLLLAIGIKDIWPDVPGLDPCYGETAHHCPDCDGYEVRGCKTVVIAAGRRAAGMALDLGTWTRQIVICTNGADPKLSKELMAKLDRQNIPVLTQRITRLVSSEGRARQLELENGMCLDCERVFFAIGHYPADDLGVQLGCKRDDEGLIEIDAHYHTSVRNVFAAGDIVPGPHLAICAASDGAIAALSIHKSLVPEEWKLE